MDRGRVVDSRLTIGVLIGAAVVVMAEDAEADMMAVGAREGSVVVGVVRG
jgi:hypothetical protein